MRTSLAWVLWSGLLSLPICLSPAQTAAPNAPGDRIAAIEKQAGGRLGVAALDTGSGRRIEYRSEERFPMCSSFKLLLAGAVLSRAEAKKESLDRRVPCGETEMLSYAPVTRVHLPEGGMTVSDLCAAVIETSDNTAAMPEAAVYSNRFGL